MHSESSQSKTTNSFNTLKSVISKKIGKRQQSTVPPTPPSRDFVDVKVNGETGVFEPYSLEGGASNDAPVSSPPADSVADGYQQV